MKAILSTTADDLYLFLVPFAVYSWNKLNTDCMVFAPAKLFEDPKFSLVYRYSNHADFRFFQAPEDKEATYAQVSRLFGACIDLPSTEMLITSDADMAVFGDFLLQEAGPGFHLFGTDLVPEKQIPLCYIKANVAHWRHAMKIKEDYQYHLDAILEPIECDHFRGNYWGKDQELAYNHIVGCGINSYAYTRARPRTQWASRRLDRDGWDLENVDYNTLVDAHLPRPGHTYENFLKIFELFKVMYPNDDLSWMLDYRKQYLDILDWNSLNGK